MGTGRALATLLAAAALSACSGAVPNAAASPTASATSIRLHGSVNADLVGQSPVGGTCSVSSFGTGASTVTTLVYNGATSAGGYVLVFSIFPYHGAATYALTQGGHSQVQVLASGSGQLVSTSGQIVVQGVSAGQAWGRLSAGLGSGQTATGATGTWRCGLSAPSPAA